MMAHIRYATQGPVSLENVHPFTRELWGIQWTFAHNGDCPKFSNVHDSMQGLPVLGQQTAAAASAAAALYNTRTSSRSCCYHPAGDTDSEAVFCAILNAIQAKFSQQNSAAGDDEDGDGGGLPTLSGLHEFLQELCREIVKNDDDTIFNFLLGCGPYTLFAYSWPGSRPGSTVWNGLHYIVREPVPATAATSSSLDNDVLLDEGRDSSRSVATTNGANHQHRVAVITTKPLTGETGWCEMRRGELIMFDHGRPHRTAACCERVEQEGRGLRSQVFAHIPNNARFCRSRSSSSLTSSTSSSGSSSGRKINTCCNLHHDRGSPPPSLPLHHQQFQEQAQVYDNDDKSSSSTINSDIENIFHSSSAAAGADATSAVITSVKCCRAIGGAPAASPTDAIPVEMKAEKRKNSLDTERRVVTKLSLATIQAETTGCY
jgi:predicted glutamine amidotransferase